MSNLLLSVMGAFAEFERALLKERQREGIAIAKKAGVYRGRKGSQNFVRVLQSVRRRRHLPASSAYPAKRFTNMRRTIAEKWSSPRNSKCP